MDIFEYKKNRMLPFEINKMNLYKKEADIMFNIYEDGNDYDVFLKITIDNMDFFNRFCDRSYKFVDVDSTVNYVYLNLYPIQCTDTKYVNTKCFYDYGENTYTITESYTDFRSMKKVDISDKEQVDRLMAGDTSLYLEINFYSMYLFMNKIAALCAQDAIHVLFYNIIDNLDDEETFNNVKREFNIAKEHADMVKRLLDI